MTNFRWTGCAAIALIAAVPVLAQQSGDVKAGVDAWSRGDYDRAVSEWRTPAERGDADAQFNLAQAYKLGRGVTTDLNRAEQLYASAAQQGHQQAIDNYGLALFQNQKKTQAVDWLRKSAERGEPRAQFVLGTMYFNGDAVAKDWVRAYALVSRAASSGLPQASSTLAQMERYIPAAERQKGITLARSLEKGEPMPPARAVQTAGLPPARPTTPPAPTPTPSPTPKQPAPAAAAARATPVSAPPAAAPVDGGWRIQLGAFGDAGNARKLWSNVATRFPGRQPHYVRAGNVTRLQVSPFASQSEASRACANVKPCLPVRP